MTWTNAALRAIVIFLYFVIATVWIPNVVVHTSFIADGSTVVRDTVVSAVWGAGLVAGLYLLRQSQKRGLI